MARTTQGRRGPHWKYTREKVHEEGGEKLLDQGRPTVKCGKAPGEVPDPITAPPVPLPMIRPAPSLLPTSYVSPHTHAGYLNHTWDDWG